jgi:anti-sigma B factor antagonist
LRVRVLDGSSAGSPYVVEVAGEIDIATVRALEDPVIGAIKAGRRPVLIDLGGCDFIDSTGIHLILRAHTLLREDRGSRPSFAVVANGHVLELFKVTALHETLPIVATRQEAEWLLDSAGAKA